MDFDLSEEQYSLQDELSRFLAECYSTARLQQVFDDAEPLDRGVWTRLAELGYAAICVPEAYEGLGLQVLDAAIASEIIGYRGAPGHYIAHTMAVMAMVLCGSEEQKRTYLPPLGAGKCIGTVAFGEDGNLWLPDQWQLQVENGRLNGSKRNVLFAGDADIAIVGLSGGALALVETHAPGVSIEQVDGIDRTRRLAWMHFENAPCELLAGRHRDSSQVVDAGLVMLAADAFGGATRALELSVEYLKTRKQFGKTISQFQAVKHQVADVGTLVESARGLYWYAAYVYDADPGQCPRVAALAKALLTDRFEFAARRMIEFHGGIGFTWEHYAQVWYKRAIFDRGYMGQPSLHRERAARLAGW